MGRGTDRRRALVEDRHSDFPANGPALYADGTEASGMTSQDGMTFVRNHAKAIIACDFFIVVTATFCLVYVFVIISWKSAPAGFCISTRRVIPRLNGRCSSSGNVSQEKSRTSSSFMTVTASIPRNWIRHFDRWV